MNWQPKETMPKKGKFLVAMREYDWRTGKFLRWYIHSVVVDEGGIIEGHHGWKISDYELWCPIPEPPDPTTLEG